MIRLVAGAVAVAFGFVAGVVSHPPHVAPPVAEAPVYEGSVVPDLLGQIVDYTGWIAGVERAEAEAEAARVEAASRPANNGVVTSGGAPDCAGFPDWFPHSIIWRESNCRRGLDTSNGYRGAYQIADFHWFGGACDGLSWLVPAEEDECTDRLSQHGTRLSPWGV